MPRLSNSNQCLRCPDHGGLRLDGPLTLRLCRRCWREWEVSAVRTAVLKHVENFLAFGHDEAAPRQIREELTD